MKNQWLLLFKIGVLLLILLLSVSVFFACDSGTEDVGDGSTEESSTSASGEESTLPEDSFDIAVGGESRFTIIAPEFPTDGEQKAFLKLRKGISEMTGVSLPFTDDWIRTGDSHDPDTYEILIGKTNYSETWSVLNETSYGSYSIMVIGRKIVLTAWSETALEAGAEALLKIFSAEQSGQDLSVPISAIRDTKMVDRTLDAIPVVPNLNMDHIYDANGAIEAIYTGATPEHFDAYIAKLTEKGYTKYAQNERGNVKSAIFTDEEDYSFHIFYEGGFKELCVMLETYNEKALPQKESTYQRVCEPLFMQLGVEYQYGSSKPQNGMCYVWRLEDGRFVILDGGFSYTLGATNLYTALKEMAHDPDDIVIAAWIVSHFHSDHVGTFLKFTEKYLQKAKIESVIYNLPTEEQAALGGMNGSSWEKISTRLKSVNPRVRFFKAHPGHVYHFANLEIEVLYTLEMFAPGDLDYYNTCSLIVDVKLEDFNMIMLGDCSEDAGSNLCLNYGETLEAEVVQVAHHGYVGGSTALYRNINPIYVFWPAGSTHYTSCENKVSSKSDKDRNAYFFMTGTRIDKVFVARATVVVLTMQEGIGFLDRTIYENIDAYVDGDGDYVEMG